MQFQIGAKDSRRIHTAEKKNGQKLEKDLSCDASLYSVVAGTLLGITNAIATIPGFLGPAVVGIMTNDNVSVSLCVCVCVCVCVPVCVCLCVCAVSYTHLTLPTRLIV